MTKDAIDSIVKGRNSVIEFRFNNTSLTFVIVYSILMGFGISTLINFKNGDISTTIVIFLIAFFGLGITILKSRIRKTI